METGSHAAKCKVMRVSLKTLLPLIFLTFVAGASGDDIIVEEGPYRFEVKLNRRANTASVYVLSGKTKLSGDKMELTLLQDHDTGQTIKLRALNLGMDPPHYQGSVAPNMGSYMGLELRFSTDLKARRVLRSMPAPQTRDRK